MTYPTNLFMVILILKIGLIDNFFHVLLLRIKLYKVIMIQHNCIDILYKVTMIKTIYNFLSGRIFIT